jgi:serine acetyltransferase
VRLAYLGLFGAKIGKGSAINRGSGVWSIPYIVIGDRVSIGFRCLLDARAGIAIGNDVVVASDTQIIAGGHDINHPNFVPSPNPPDPIVIDDHVWIASRAMIMPCLLGRGAVVAAHAVVNKEVPRWPSWAACPPSSSGSAIRKRCGTAASTGYRSSDRPHAWRSRRLMRANIADMPRNRSGLISAAKPRLV